MVDNTDNNKQVDMSDCVRVNWRIPRTYHAHLKHMADTQMRDVNSQVVMFLKDVLFTSSKDLKQVKRKYLTTFAPSRRKPSSTVRFVFAGGKITGYDKNDISVWKEAYPAVDIDGEIKRAEMWLVANPAKVKKNYRRYLTNWFSRKQERGGSTPGNRFEEPEEEIKYGIGV